MGLTGIGKWLFNRPKVAKTTRTTTKVPGKPATSRTTTTHELGQRRILAGPEKALTVAYTADWALQGVERITERWLPRALSGVSVRIWGSPQSNLSNIFFLACAVASNANPDVFRGARTRVFGASIVPHGKFVQVNIVFTVGGLLGGGGESGRAVVKGLIPDSFGASQVWPAFLSNSAVNGVSNEPLGTVPKISQAAFSNVTTTSVPLIATTLSGSNPFPQLDGISRQSDLTALVSAALMGSCVAVPCPTTGNYVSEPTAATATARAANPTITSPKGATVTVYGPVHVNSTGFTVKPIKSDPISLQIDGSDEGFIPQDCGGG